MIALAPQSVLTLSQPGQWEPARFAAAASCESWPDEVPAYFPSEEPEEPSELDDPLRPSPLNDIDWEVFLPDELEPVPEPGDFWIDSESE